MCIIFGTCSELYLILFSVRIKHQARFVKLTMALLNSLPPYPNTLAYRCAVDKNWFMSPSLWTHHVVNSTITDTGSFTNDVNYRCLVFLQEIDVLKADPPSCRTCNQDYSPLVQSTIERKRKRGPANTKTEMPTTPISELPRRTNVTKK